MENFDYEKLKSELKEYFGSATPLNGFAYVDLIRVEKASEYELVKIAINNGFNLNDYKESSYARRYIK